MVVSNADLIIERKEDYGTAMGRAFYQGDGRTGIPVQRIHHL